VHIANSNSKYTFTTAEPPEEAGVDPFLLLIDRVPDDNTKKVVLTSASAAPANQIRGKWHISKVYHLFAGLWRG
jgi:hypothetical protein